METWKLITIIAVLILCIVSTWYMVKLGHEEIRSSIYVYTKSGRHYLPLFKCAMKCPVSGEWFEGIVYQDYETKHVFARYKKDFLNRFVKLKEWENDKGRVNNGLDTHSA